MKNNFFAFLSRMKYINRWALMRNEQSENLTEHSFEVAYIAHALAVIGNKRLGKASHLFFIVLFRDPAHGGILLF